MAFAMGRTSFTKLRQMRARRVVPSSACMVATGLWVSPEVERTYYPDNSPVAVSQHNNAVRFTAQREELPPGTNLQKELEIELAATGSHVRITHRIRNHDAHSTTLAPWSPTMMRAGGRAILPLSPRIAMDKDHYLPVGVFGMWSFTDLADPRWVLGTSYHPVAATGKSPRPLSRSRWEASTTRPAGELISAGTLFL